jgi:molybdopterin/thiamine biosynthesis adenylyltransferase
MVLNRNDRYSRQIILKDFGPEAQQQLAHARVLIIGVGGLGCPVLMYLAAAGVGTIGIADGDHVELNNLHRQILFDTPDVGLSKVQVAFTKMKLKNPEVKIVAHGCFVSTANVFDLLACYDLIVDATDNFSSRYMISDACHLMKKPLVYGAVSCYEGQVGVFNFNPKGKAVKLQGFVSCAPCTRRSKLLYYRGCFRGIAGNYRPYAGK